MKIKDIMTEQVVTVSPDSPVQSAAQHMADMDVGALPVVENDRLIGIITDRDIAIRAVARGKGGDCKIRDVMSEEIKYCYDDQQAETIATNMGTLQIRRLPVVNRQKRLVGIVALADLAVSDVENAGGALSGISQPTSSSASMDGFGSPELMGGD